MAILRLGLIFVFAAGISAKSEVFQKHARWLAVGPNPTSIAAPDLNGDGLPEIITADRGDLVDPQEERPANDKLSFLLATGVLTYSRQTELNTGFAPYCVVAANMDGQKLPDLVVGNFLGVKRRDLTVLRNMGENVFKNVDFFIDDDTLPYKRMRDSDQNPIFTTPGITSLVVRDFNGDGFRDVIAAGWASDVLLFYPNHPETVLGEAVLIPAEGGPRDVATGDFNNDGHADLAVTLYSSGEIGLWRGDGKGGFQPAGRFAARGPLPHRVRVADINSDGLADLIVSHVEGMDSVTIWYGEKDFSFPVSQELTLGRDYTTTEQDIRDMVVDDFNRDNRPDIAVACAASSQVVLFVNQPPTSVEPVSFNLERYTFKDAAPRALCVADFDRNGCNDVGVALWGANAVALLLSR